ncbi:MAG TPA: hypothetical protein VKU19_25515 [Bryobacteraceae bacterium]|nr:hypothetical protein [Bryobacteraceae bacterium]
MDIRAAKETDRSVVRTVTVLSVDPIANDTAALTQIFSRSPWALSPNAKWTLASTDNTASALTTLRAGQISVLLCGCDHKPDTWKEMLEELRQISQPPMLIVTSRTADERLWAEALNLGAYDVLATPYDQSEVTRVLSLAWLHWKERHDLPSRASVAGSVS